jgi:hypothetical protein
LKQINNEVMICCSLRPRDRILHPSIIHSKSSDIMILPKPHRHLTNRNHWLCYQTVYVFDNNFSRQSGQFPGCSNKGTSYGVSRWCTLRASEIQESSKFSKIGSISTYVAYQVQLVPSHYCYCHY